MLANMCCVVVAREHATNNRTDKCMCFVVAMLRDVCRSNLLDVVKQKKTSVLNVSPFMIVYGFDPCALFACTYGSKQ